jgi:hypothetical protein
MVHKTVQPFARTRKSGQTLVEYVLVVALIATFGYLVSGPMRDLLQRVEFPLRNKFKYAYKYGHPDACGKDDDLPCTGPKLHPRYDIPGSARIVTNK